MGSLIELHYLSATGVKNLLDSGLAVGHSFEFGGRNAVVKLIGTQAVTTPVGQVIPIVVEREQESQKHNKDEWLTFIGALWDGNRE
jgi:hypothetical protein